jgi:hypothetical protein
MRDGTVGRSERYSPLDAVRVQCVQGDAFPGPIGNSD